MGAFDSYAADVACPTCGDIHHITGQTKFFDPDYQDTRYFRPGVAEAADFTPADFPTFCRDGWIRMRPSTDDTRFTLLVTYDDMYACSCDRWLAPLLHFTFAPGQITMERIELLDAREAIADHCDFVDAESVWDGDLGRFRDALLALEGKPFEDKAAWLRTKLNERFRVDDEDRELDTSPHDGTITIIGPTQCEACGDVRERAFTYWWLGTFFEPAWPSSVLFLGARLAFGDAWLADDVDRGQFFRARHPVGETTLKILGMRLSYGCRCGAGMARLVARFDRHPGALELVELTLRAVTSRDDVRDIDFIEGQTRAGRSGEEPRTREYVLGWTLV